MTKKQTIEYKKLHNENADMLLEMVGGLVDSKHPAEITLANASCLVARVIFNNSKMLAIVNKVN